MRRRAYLATCAGITGCLAGCSGILDGPGDSGSDGEDLGPAETVAAFFDAVFAGDVEGANQRIHPEGELPELTESRLEEIDRSDQSYENATVLEREDGVAIVSIEILTETGERVWTTVQRFELHEHDGAWKLYSRRRTRTQGPDVPAVQWSVEERAGDDGRTTAVAFAHDSGEAVDVTSLRVVVETDEIGPTEGGSLEAGDTVVVPFTAGTEGYDAGTDVAIDWESPTGDVTTRLAEYTLESDAAGELGSEFRVE